jgi:GNAT superfamily N-acetyltransferase
VSPVVEVVRTYLELASRDQLRAAYTSDPRVHFVPRPGISVAHYRRLYAAVGARWHWHDRDAWPDEELAAYLASPAITVWECLVGDDAAGYFELATRDDGAVEILYFGLADPFIGQGLGKAMLTRAVEESFALGATRVRLDTCTLDSPRALPNYIARGFQAVRTLTYEQQIPPAD